MKMGAQKHNENQAVSIQPFLSPCYVTALPSLQYMSKKFYFFLFPLAVVPYSLIFVYEEALDSKIESEDSKK